MRIRNIGLSMAEQDMFIRNFDSTVADRNMDVYNDYMKIVKQWGDGLEMLQDAGVPVLFRSIRRDDQSPPVPHLYQRGQGAL